MITFHEPKLVNIVVNGFSIRDTILDALKQHQRLSHHLGDCDIEELADDIQEAFAVKLRLIQGLLPIR